MFECFCNIVSERDFDSFVLQRYVGKYVEKQAHEVKYFWEFLFFFKI